VQPSPFKIYDASAGSGKTHTLTKEYLKIILSSKKGFGQILALTFTNKAVEEMKGRILTSLFEFATINTLEKDSPLFNDIVKELPIEAASLQQKAAKTLKDILHNYAFFDVSTLDKFTHRLIRTFAKDLKLPQNFEVILDRDLLLNEAVSRLVFKAGKEPVLTKILLEFALEKIDEDKSWNISTDLFRIGKILFEENHKKHIATFADKSIPDFIALRKLLQQKSTILEKKSSASATSILEFILASGMEYTDFLRQSLPKHFQKIAAGEYKPSKLYNTNLSENIKAGKLLKSGFEFPAPEIYDQISQVFFEQKKDIYEIAFLANAYRSIVPLTVLNAIQQELKAIQNERDQLSINEFNAIISKEVKDQPAPFIYERLGEKYRHFFIDEFQDTSVLQWENLTPLIDNALSSADEQGNPGSLFLVGDTKQAIYRWRGGEAEQFLQLANEAVSPFAVQQHVFALETNYRSKAEIVEFNNSFFQCISALLHKSDYQELFVAGNKQLSHATKGGYVELRFVNEKDEEDIDALYGTHVLETIRSVDPNATALHTICILVRKHKHGVALAHFLTQNAIPVISTQSLLVNSSEKVRFLIDLLRYLSDPSNQAVSFALLFFLSKTMDNRSSFITTNLHQLKGLFTNSYGFDISIMPQKSVYDILELAIKQFALAPDSDSYLVALMDYVLEIENNEGVGIELFLSFWDKKKEKLPISAPAVSNAVRIMTIHKAKGLEFPIVIFPYANENIYQRTDKKMWLPIDPLVYEGFDRLLVGEKKEVTEYGENAKLLFQEEEERMELDAFNMLYVALTRAEHSLFIITKNEITKNGEHNAKHYSGLFIQYLKEKGLWSADQACYRFGTFDLIPKTDAPSLRSIPYQYTYKNRANFRILAAAGSLWETERETALAQGNLLHHIMSYIESVEDVENALAFFSRKGDISNAAFDQIKETVYAIVRHPQLHPYFKNDLLIKNEKDLITASGQLLRPDRLVFDNNTVTVIDYKSGKKDPTYHQQLYAYADALEDMGYLVAHKIIVYSSGTVTPEFI